MEQDVNKHGVTDGDRDLFIVLSNADDEMAERIMSDDAFTWEVYQITRYRQAAEQRIVAKIVAWLRIQQRGGVSDNYPGYYARRIEDGEWK